MSISEQTPYAVATLSTATDAIAFAYPFEADEELVVQSDGRGVLTDVTHYTVTGAGDAGGGTVTMVGGTIGEVISITRSTPVSQLLTLRTNGKYFIDDLEAALDKLTKINQEQDQEVGNYVRFPNGEATVFSGELTTAASRVSTILGFDATGALKYYANSTTGEELPASTAENNYLSGSTGGGWLQETPTEVKTTLGLTVGTDVQAYDAGLQSISGLTTAADKGIYATASDTYATFDLTSAARKQLAKGAPTSVTSTSYTAVLTDDVILVDDDTAGAAVTVDLMTAASAGAGFKLTIKKLGSTATVTIDANGSETIDGVLTEDINIQYDWRGFVSDGSNWHII